MPACHPETSGRVREQLITRIYYSLTMTYSVYILYRGKTDGFYIGYSTDLPRRINQHNMGLTQSTRGKGPWKIVYTEAFLNKSDALKREIFLKKQKNKNFYRRLIADYEKELLKISVSK